MVLCEWHMGYSHTQNTSSTCIKSTQKKKAVAKYIFYLCLSMQIIHLFSRHFEFIYRQHQDENCLSPRELATDWINRLLYCLKIQFNLSHPRQRKHSKKVTNENTSMVRSLVTPGTAACVGPAINWCWTSPGFFFFFFLWKVVHMQTNCFSLLFLKLLVWVFFYWYF